MNCRIYLLHQPTSITYFVCIKENGEETREGQKLKSENFARNNLHSLKNSRTIMEKLYHYYS